MYLNQSIAHEVVQESSLTLKLRCRMSFPLVVDTKNYCFFFPIVGNLMGVLPTTSAILPQRKGTGRYTMLIVASRKGKMCEALSAAPGNSLVWPDERDPSHL